MYKKTQPRKKSVSLLMLLIASLTACSASEQDQTNDASTLAAVSDTGLSRGAHCDYWGRYAVTILNNYEAQKMAGTDNPLEKVKSWINYDSSEEGSPSQAYFDAVLLSVEAQQTPQVVSEVGLQACAKFTEDQMDPANFYNVID